MSNTDVAEILKLPAEERMRLVEMIWESLVSDAPALPLSDAHRTVLAWISTAYRSPNRGLVY